MLGPMASGTEIGSASNIGAGAAEHRPNQRLERTHLGGGATPLDRALGRARASALIDTLQRPAAKHTQGWALSGFCEGKGSRCRAPSDHARRCGIGDSNVFLSPSVFVFITPYSWVLAVEMVGASYRVLSVRSGRGGRNAGGGGECCGRCLTRLAGALRGRHR